MSVFQLAVAIGFKAHLILRFAQNDKYLKEGIIFSMYDFYFGTKEEIAKDEQKFLLTIKRMLPRWCNSIPDSEYLAILDILERYAPKENPILVETGTGASSIVLLHYAMKYGGTLYSWDFVGPKGAYLRGVCSDTLLQYHKCRLSECWKFIAYSSLSPYLGLPILSELVDQVDMCFLDSEHTLDTLLGEVNALDPLLVDGSIVAIDDANYTYRHTNFAYINVFRRKLNLSEVASPTENIGDPFYVEVQRDLQSRWTTVNHIKDTFKTSYKNDIFWSYYRSDREAMAAVGMEKLGNLEHRFDAWQIFGCQA